MPVLKNICMAATCQNIGSQSEIHPINNAAIAWKNGIIEWVGKEAELPDQFKDWPSEDAGNRLLIPGLVECHTHLAFGGWRSDEYELRALGRPYIDIAKSGGGILSTVKATRKATKEELIAKCEVHLREMAALGITTVECKSGYGLNREDELKVLEVYEELSKSQPLEIVATYLGGHMIPPEYKEKRADYIKLVSEEMIPEIADRNLAEFCDVFVEETALNIDEARTILNSGNKHGLRAKLHADQLSSGGGAELAAEVNAVSADHLEYISEDGIREMAKVGVVAVSLPLASFYLRQPAAPVRKMMQTGLEVAVSTDFNPGSAPSYHLPYAMVQACIMQKMSPAEVLKGSTIIAAKAINRDKKTGSLEKGKQADFAIIDAPDVNHWLYHFRPNACVATYKNGERVF